MKKLLLFIKQHPWKVLLRCGMVMAAIVIILGIALYIEVQGRIKLVSPGATPFFQDSRGNYISEGWGRDSRKGYWVIDGDVPHRVKQCFIAVEDKRFYRHNGVDWKSLGRAFFNKLSGGPKRGASTIAMQVARMQYALDGKFRRGYWQKICESVIARLLVSKYGREAVLKHYLRLVPMGNRIHGAAYASRRYFRKPLQDLGWAEAALLAALPKAPGQMNVFSSIGFRRAVKRAELVLNLLHDQQRIGERQFLVSMRHLRRLQPPIREKRPYHSFHAIAAMENALKRYPERKFRRPIQSTLDLDLQFFLTQTAENSMNELRYRGAGNIAIIAVERKTGRVKGYLGSSDYYDVPNAGAIDYARTPRSAGSTLKPFIFALGLADKKFTPSSVIADLPFYVAHSSGQYMICNYDNRFLGPMLYRKALANSRNAPAVRVLKAVGQKRVHGFFRRTGLEKSNRTADHYGLGLAVGGLYVTLQDLVRSYGMLANEGQNFELQWFEDTIDRELLKETPQGTEIGSPGKRARQYTGSEFSKTSYTCESNYLPLTRNSSNERILPAEVARQITLYLSDPGARLPSFKRMGPLEYPFPVAVKTGTSQGFRDAWAIAWSDKYIVGVWIGHPKNDPMKKINGTTAARVVKRIMLHLHPNSRRRLDEIPFPPPRGYRPIKVCTLSGQKAHDQCSDIVLEYFYPGAEPADTCTVHRVYAVDRRSGKMAGPFTPPAEVEQKTFAVFPPEYTAWAASKGFEKPPVMENRLPRASIEIRNPIDNLKVLVDPETPLRFQTLSLKAEVTPSISHIVWIIDGKPQQPTPYPYVHRWRLTPGKHTFQARFPNANIASRIVRISVNKY